MVYSPWINYAGIYIQWLLLQSVFYTIIHRPTSDKLVLENAFAGDQNASSQFKVMEDISKLLSLNLPALVHGRWLDGTTWFVKRSQAGVHQKFLGRWLTRRHQKIFARTEY